MSIELRYQVVSLSRAPWWNNLLLRLDTWHVGSLARGSLVPKSDERRTYGVPTAMILTSDVKLRAKWSESGRAALVENTHFGPWAVRKSDFSAMDASGEQELRIPGTSLIACLYRELPMLPPQSDPDLPP